MRILIVEDEPKTSSLISSFLKEQGYETECAKDGSAGAKLAFGSDFDALIVDIMLPKLDGLTLVQQLRSQGITIPVLMLSARGEVEQRVEGLEVGADDYLPKPFAISELLARVRSLVRRNSLQKPSLRAVGDLTFDPLTRETRRGGRRVDLSTREVLLLECLIKADGAVVSRRDIIAAVWEYDFDPGTNLVEVYVRRLRDKIDRDHSAPVIHTIRGLGYALREKP